MKVERINHVGIAAPTILPGTGRGTAAAGGGGGGADKRLCGWETPSVSPAGCHLPVPGRIL